MISALSFNGVNFAGKGKAFTQQHVQPKSAANPKTPQQLAQEQRQREFEASLADKLRQEDHEINEALRSGAIYGKNHVSGYREVRRVRTA